MKIPVNLTLKQVQNIVAIAEEESQYLEWDGVLYFEVYPGLLEIKLADRNAQTMKIWDKLINNGSGPREKLRERRMISFGLTIEEMKEICDTAQKEIGLLQSGDDLLYITVEPHLLTIKIDVVANDNPKEIFTRKIR